MALAAVALPPTACAGSAAPPTVYPAASAPPIVYSSAAAPPTVYTGASAPPTAYRGAAAALPPTACAGCGAGGASPAGLASSPDSVGSFVPAPAFASPHNAAVPPRGGSCGSPWGSLGAAQPAPCASASPAALAAALAGAAVTPATAPGAALGVAPVVAAGPAIAAGGLPAATSPGAALAACAAAGRASLPARAPGGAAAGVLGSLPAQPRAHPASAPAQLLAGHLSAPAMAAAATALAPLPPVGAPPTAPMGVAAPPPVPLPGVPLATPGAPLGAPLAAPVPGAPADLPAPAPVAVAAAAMAAEARAAAAALSAPPPAAPAAPPLRPLPGVPPGSEALVAGERVVMPGQPMSLTAGFVSPEDVTRQKEEYQRHLDEQERKGREALGQQIERQREYLRLQAQQQKEIAAGRWDQHLRAQEMAAEQDYQEQLARLQDAASQLRAALDNQAGQLVVEYNQRRVQEELNYRIYEAELQEWEGTLHLTPDQLKNADERLQAQMALAALKNTTAMRRETGLPEIPINRWVPDGLGTFGAAFGGVALHPGLQAPDLAAQCFSAASGFAPSASPYPMATPEQYGGALQSSAMY